MTKEEAIGNLRYAIRWNDTPKKEALEMAIKALEQGPCEDCISRQAVLEYIEASDAELGHSSENELVCQDIKELPPVTPEQDPCGDCISRQEVLDYIYNDLGLGDEENGNDVERQMELEKSYKYVKSLKPVNPQPKTGYWVDIFSKFTAEEQDHLWMYMIFNRDKIIEKTEGWTKEAEERGMTLTEYLESISTLNDKGKLSWLGKNCKDCGNEKCKKLGKLPKRYSCALWQAESEE